jgi:predicted CoA-binding protein
MTGMKLLWRSEKNEIIQVGLNLSSDFGSVNHPPVKDHDMLSQQEAFEIAAKVKTVAVVGMTDGKKPGRASFDIPQRLQALGVQLIPVNPMIQEALGLPSLPSVAGLPAGVEVVDVFRPPEAIPALAEELCALPQDKRPAVVWLQTGIRHPEAEQKLEQAGYQVVADRCLGTMAALARRGA